MFCFVLNKCLRVLEDECDPIARVTTGNHLERKNRDKSRIGSKKIIIGLRRKLLGVHLTGLVH